MTTKQIVLLCAAAVLGIFLLATGCSSFITVPSGSVGVVTHFGATTGELKSPGLSFITPFISGVERMDTQTHAYKAVATAVTRDLQDVTTEVTINYRLLPEGAVKMYNEMRRDYGDRIIVPAVQEAIKAATAKYALEELTAQRAEVRTNIENSVRERLLKHHILLDQASITNFQFSEQFSQAIEKKVVAVQNALAAENRVKEAKFNADAAIETARGNAEAIRIQAQAIQQQGGAEYVKLQAVGKWNGVLPQYMTGGAPVPFLDVSK